MDELLPILGFIFYLLFQLFAGGKKKKKRVKTNKKKKPTFVQELEKQLRELENSAQPQVESKPKPVLQSKTPKTIRPFQAQQVTQEVQREAKSLEITEPPYSNLEEGILDKTHQSKFKHHDTSEFTHFNSSAFIHHDLTANEIGTQNKNKDQINLLKDFDPQKAFIHSLIFERKYFEV